MSDQCLDRFHNYRAVPSRVEVTQTVHSEEPLDHLIESYSVRSVCGFDPVQWTRVKAIPGHWRSFHEGVRSVAIDASERIRHFSVAEFVPVIEAKNLLVHIRRSYQCGHYFRSIELTYFIGVKSSNYFQGDGAFKLRCDADL